MTNILVPLDGSRTAECVLPHTVALAKVLDAQIMLVHVLAQPSSSLGLPKTEPLTWFLKKSEANIYLESVKTNIEKTELSVQTILLEGYTPEQIVKLVYTSKTDLLVLSGYGENNSSSGYISSVVQHILQHIRTSTLIIRSDQPVDNFTNKMQYQRLLVPLDGSQRAGSAIPIAMRLAQSHNAELWLVHIVSKPEMARRMPMSQADTDLISQFVERNQDEGNKYLTQIQSQMPFNIRTRLLISDNVAATLQNFSEQEKIDLIILSAHGYSGEAQRAYGSITNRFITDSTVPLLIVQDLPHETTHLMKDGITVDNLIHGK